MASLNTMKMGEVLIANFQDSHMLDNFKIQQLGTELLALVDRTEYGKLLLNFEHVKFMSSAMLGQLILLNKKCKADNVRLKMCHIDPNIFEVFKLMKLHKVLDIHADEATALTAFERKGFFS